MPVLVLVASYLLGTFPTALLVGHRAGVDPTATGSGNPGASNVYRNAGRRAGAAVLTGDLVKGSLAAVVGLAVGGRPLGFAAGVAAVTGHVAPATRGFRGGKGVATAAGAALVLEPVASVVLAAVWLAVARIGRTASLASLAAAGCFPVALVIMGRDAGELVLASVLSSIVVVRHAANLRRLLRREEVELDPRPAPVHRARP